MKTIDAEGLGYPIYLYENEIAYFEEQLLENVILNLESEKKMIITDQVVYDHYGDLIKRLNAHTGVFLYIISSGEGSKSLLMAEKIWSELAQKGFHRNDMVIALGGGVVGDLTGFVASNYMRGIPWIQVPTTLLSQIDSSVGGKVAVNLPEAKNLIGQFYNPKSVWICTSFLNTLDRPIFRDGLGEMFKYGYLADSDLLFKLDQLPSIDAIRDTEEGRKVLFDLVYQCIAIKIAVVLKDFNELNERRFLNLGHSFGHAIEGYTGYEISHGYAVMLGIEWIIKCSYLLENKNPNLSVSERASLENAFTSLRGVHLMRMKKYGFQGHPHLTVSNLLSYLIKDKKAQQRSISLILLKVEHLASRHGEEATSENDIISSILKRCYIHKWPIEDLVEVLS